MYNPVVLITFTVVQAISRTLHSCKMEPLYPLNMNGKKKQNKFISMDLRRTDTYMLCNWGWPFMVEVRWYLGF